MPYHSSSIHRRYLACHEALCQTAGINVKVRVSFKWIYCDYHHRDLEKWKNILITETVYLLLDLILFKTSLLKLSMWASYVIHFMVMTFLSTLLIKINEHYCHHSHFYYILLGAWSWLAPPLVNLLLLVVFRTHSTFTFMVEKTCIAFSRCVCSNLPGGVTLSVSTLQNVSQCDTWHCHAVTQSASSAIYITSCYIPVSSTSHSSRCLTQH